MKTSRILLASFIAASCTLLAVHAENTPEKSTPATSVPAKTATTPTTAPKINWEAFDKGSADAKTANKHMLVQITSKSCGYCRKMEAEVFTDTSVIDFITNQFIPVRLWGDSDHQLDIKGYKISEKEFSRSEFVVPGYPTFYVIAPSGQKLTSFIGYRDTPELMQILGAVKKYIDTARTEIPAENKGNGK